MVLNKLQQLARKYRKPAQDILPLFYTRWSPRSMTGEKMTEKDLLPLFEAARWAPSSYNGQPWRFVIALTQKDKDQFMNFLGDFNQQWCKKASALVVICSQKNFEYNNKPNRHHSFDTGSAWCSLALEGARRGYVVHGMAGFEADKARTELKIPERYEVEAMCAIGKLDKPENLPPEIAKSETPNHRKKLPEIISWGKFTWK